MSIYNKNPYDLPLDEPELMRVLLAELPDEVLAWYGAWLAPGWKVWRVQRRKRQR